jgi:DNA processing protein
VAALAQMVIVVEAGERPVELLHARLAGASHGIVGAVPGRVSAPMARGPHLLLREGAQLVRDAQDALDALYGAGTPRPASATRGSELDPGVRSVFERVSAGCDTLAKLTAQSGDTHDTLLALAHLELSGALVRGDGGRYLVGAQAMSYAAAHRWSPGARAGA